MKKAGEIPKKIGEKSRFSHPFWNSNPIARTGKLLSIPKSRPNPLKNPNRGREADDYYWFTSPCLATCLNPELSRTISYCHSRCWNLYQKGWKRRWEKMTFWLFWVSLKTREEPGGVLGFRFHCEQGRVGFIW